MKEIHIENKEKLKNKIKAIKKGGLKELHVISDFDRTLTKAFVNGKSPTFYEFIRAGNYLPDDYVKKSYALYDKYRPIEVADIPLEKKKEKMEEWWSKHYDLLIEKGLNMEIIKDIIKKDKLQLREGARQFLDKLNEKEVPILILSSGIGNIIKEYLKSKGYLTSNVHIISNFFEFDKDGKAVTYTRPLVHSYNKTEVQVKNHPYKKEILERKNALLLGDSLGDLGMIEGIEHDCVLKVGFLNKDTENKLEKYALGYDVVILNDGSMEYVNELMEKIESN